MLAFLFSAFDEDTYCPKANGYANENGYNCYDEEGRHDVNWSRYATYRRAYHRGSSDLDRVYGVVVAEV